MAASVSVMGKTKAAVHHLRSAAVLHPRLGGNSDFYLE